MADSRDSRRIQNAFQREGNPLVELQMAGHAAPSAYINRVARAGRPEKGSVLHSSVNYFLAAAAALARGGATKAQRQIPRKLTQCLRPDLGPITRCFRNSLFASLGCPNQFLVTTCAVSLMVWIGGIVDNCPIQRTDGSDSCRRQGGFPKSYIARFELHFQLIVTSAG